MKSFKEIFRTTILEVAVIIGLAMLLTVPAQAQVPMAPSTNLFISSPTVLTNAQTITNNAPAAGVAMFRGRGIAIGMSCTSTDNCAGVVNFTLQTSIDGLNWTSAGNPVVGISPGNTATTTIVTNIAPTVIDNVAYLRLFKMANTHSNSLTVSNVYYSVFP